MMKRFDPPEWFIDYETYNFHSIYVVNRLDFPPLVNIKYQGQSDLKWRWKDETPLKDYL